MHNFTSIDQAAMSSSVESTVKSSPELHFSPTPTSILARLFHRLGPICIPGELLDGRVALIVPFASH